MPELLPSAPCDNNNSSSERAAAAAAASTSQLIFSLSFPSQSLINVLARENRSPSNLLLFTFVFNVVLEQGPQKETALPLPSAPAPPPGADFSSSSSSSVPTCGTLCAFSLSLCPLLSRSPQHLIWGYPPLLRPPPPFSPFLFFFFCNIFFLYFSPFPCVCVWELSPLPLPPPPYM